MKLGINKINTPLIGQNVEQMEFLFENLGESTFRGRQLFDWIYRRKIDDISMMTNLPTELRSRLKSIPFHPLKLVINKYSKSNETTKFVFMLKDGQKVESVLMKEDNRITICLSTQVGCAVDCKFCATAKMGFKKNLSVGEIIDQFFQIQSIINQRITNVVFMGMGEPFLNYDNTINAANLLHHPKGINLGAKRITISTAGIVPKINRYTKERQPYRLAVSLNATTDDDRTKIMPLTKIYSFIELMNSVRNYANNARERVTFEYVLLNGVNDSEKEAKELINLLGNINCKLNIIPYNEIDEKFQRPSKQKIEKFLKIFSKVKFPVTIRRSKGTDITAGCGQLIINSI